MRRYWTGFRRCSLLGSWSARPAGNERMRQIAAAVQEGAKAYLNRQVVTISVIAIIIFVSAVFL